MQSGMLWLSVLESAKLNENIYIYIYYGRLQTLKLWGGRFLNLGKPSLSIYINVDQKSLVMRGNERKGEGKKQLFSFILFFFWLLHEVEEISISVLYRNNSGGTVQI